MRVSFWVGSVFGALFFGSFLRLLAQIPGLSPEFTDHPISGPGGYLNVSQGATVTLSVKVRARNSGGLGALYWTKDGRTLGGGQPHLIIDSVTHLHSGWYQCVATNLFTGEASYSNSVFLAVVPSSYGSGRLSNLSIRANAARGEGALIIGFGVSVGPPKPVLIRAIGPSLAAFGIENVAADPSLELFSGSFAIAGNDDWGGGPDLVASGRFVGAFPLASAQSRDAAMFVPAMAAGGYTVQVSSAGAEGVALAELYDTSPDSSLPFRGMAPTDLGTTPPVVSRLTNLSARAFSGQLSGQLIAGFTISGNTSRTVLLRGLGPSLRRFGVIDALGNPRIELRQTGGTAGGRLIASNESWRDASTMEYFLAQVFSVVGAFFPEVNEACLLATLPPGSYTVHVIGEDGGSGVALVELFDLSPYSFGAR